MRRFLVLSFFVVLVLGSCSSDDDDAITMNIESLEFGSFAGECFGDCFDVFRINNETLEEDRVVDFYTENYSFQGSFTFSDPLLQKHKGILNTIPKELVNGSDKAFGCPDCADQGGFYIKVQISEEKSITYIIDTDDTDDQSGEVVAFKKRIFEIIKELSDIN